MGHKMYEKQCNSDKKVFCMDTGILMTNGKASKAEERGPVGLLEGARLKNRA